MSATNVRTMPILVARRVRGQWVVDGPDGREQTPSDAVMVERVRDRWQASVRFVR